MNNAILGNFKCDIVLPCVNTDVNEIKKLVINTFGKQYTRLKTKN